MKMAYLALPAAAAVALAGCGAAHAGEPGAVSYENATAVVAALDAHGAPCTNTSLTNGSTATGSLGSFVLCSGVTAGDTSVGIFDTHAHALAHAQNMINVGDEIKAHSTAEVVGPNWVVNTTPAYAARVQKAIGGQLLQ
jgi:hypothetical protein